jgi:hypothetical protein
MGIKKEGEISKNISHNIVLQCIDTLLDCMDQRRFVYIDITGVRTVYTAMCKRAKGLQKQLTITKYFSEFSV